MKKQWSLDELKEILSLPFNDILYNAHTIFRENFNQNEMQVSTLLSIKTGKCPENCSYCPQSAHYNTNLQNSPLMEKEEVISKARKAHELGSTRFCIGAAWKGPTNQNLDKVCAMISGIKELRMQTCASLGLLDAQQAKTLKKAGLDYYNHNIDTSPEYYKEIITTRNFQNRLNTLDNVRIAGIKICCGGIIGMGESNEDRLKMLAILANLPVPPESVPINKLIPIPGTPLANVPEVDSFDFVRIIAVARIILPKSHIRLSAGRENMSNELQSLCFFAGANSIFYGEKLLTAKNPLPKQDTQLLQKLGIAYQKAEH